MQDARYLRSQAELCLQMAHTVRDKRLHKTSGLQPRGLLFPTLPALKARALKTRPLKDKCHDRNHRCHQ
jgi:hypothetical protein